MRNPLQILGLLLVFASGGPTAGLTGCGVEDRGAGTAFDTGAGSSIDTGTSPRVARIARRENHDTWADYLSGADRAAESAPGTPRRVFFIGIDGAAWNILDPLIAEGKLPNLARLKREGSSGVLNSVDCYVSPPAWVSFATGYLPEKTGVYTFGRWDRESQEFAPITAADVRVPSIWDAVSQAGRKVAVANLPVTYPVRPVNGLMVSGLMTPVQLVAQHGQLLQFLPVSPGARPPELPVSFSPPVAARVVSGGENLELYLLDGADDGQVEYDGVHLRILEKEAGGAQAAPRTFQFRLGDFSPWLGIRQLIDDRLEPGFMRVAVHSEHSRRGVYRVRMSRTLFSVADTEVRFTYPDTLAGVLARQFEYYFPSTFLRSELVPDFTTDSARWAEFFLDHDDWDLALYVFTQTDNIQHLEGVTGRTQQVYQILDGFLGRVIERLDENSTLVIASDHGFKEYTFSLDLNLLLQQAGLLVYTEDKQIDHARTLVFHNLWRLYFNHALLNRDELTRRGIEPQAGEKPAAALARWLERLGRNLTLGEQRHPLPLELAPVPAGAVEPRPDMVVRGCYDNYLVEFWNLRRPAEKLIRRLNPDEKWNHTREGIYFAYGAGVRAGVEAEADIQDLTPTMLYLMDLPVGEGMDGRVITEILDSALLGERPLEIVRQYEDISRDDFLASEDDEDMEQKLRSLGYVR